MQEAVRIASRAYAEHCGWEHDEDVEMAVEAAEIMVAALYEAGLLVEIIDAS